MKKSYPTAIIRIFGRTSPQNLMTIVPRFASLVTNFLTYYIYLLVLVLFGKLATGAVDLMGYSHSCFIV